MLPLESHPQSVYFLLNLDCFTRAWDIWLGYALEYAQYDVSSLSAYFFLIYSLTH